MAAGPIVCTTELDSHNIHNTLMYEYAYGRLFPAIHLSCHWNGSIDLWIDRSVKLNTIALSVKNTVENIFFPNIVNNTFFQSNQPLLVPIVFFTTANPYSARMGPLEQEIEEIKMNLRLLFKTHFRTRRVNLLTEFVYLRNNITLTSAIRATFIESISLFTMNNTVTYKPFSRIVRNWIW